MFGQAVRAHRKRLGLTQEELASQAAISVRSLRYLESGGIARPRLATVRLLADALGLDGADRHRFCQAGWAESVDEVSSNGLDRPPDLAMTGDGPVLSAGVPAELPADVPRLTGRDAETATVRGLLAGEADAGARMVVIHGSGGVGKSALAVHVAHRLKQEYPDGQLYVDLHGATPDAKPLRAREVLARFLRSLGHSCAYEDEEELAGRFRSVVAGRRLLLVLDDARHAVQVRPLLPGDAGCAVVVTSRRALISLEATHYLRLDVLDQQNAQRVLCQRLGDERVAAEPQAAKEVARRCGGLPLALTIAAARLAASPQRSIQSLADRLANEERLLDELDADDRAVRASFAVSYRSLAEDKAGFEAAEMFRLLGLHAGPDIAPATAAALAGISAVAAADRLDRLVEVGLANSHHADRYRLHDLLCLFAREIVRQDDSPASQSAMRRMWHFYLATARNALRTHRPQLTRRIGLAPENLTSAGLDFSDRAAAYEWLNTEVENLVAVARQAARLPEDGPLLAASLAAMVYLVVVNRGQHEELMLDLAQIGVDAAVRSGSALHECCARCDLAHMWQRRRRFDDAAAQLEPALLAAKRARAPDWEAGVLHLYGQTHRMMGRLDSALIHLRASLELSAVHGPAAIHRNTLSQLGFLHEQSNRFHDALAAHQQSLALAEATGETQGQSSDWTNIGHLYQRAGQPEQALECFEQAQALAERIAMTGTLLEADYLWGFGLALGDLGQPGLARDHWRRSAEILHRLGCISETERHAIGSATDPETPSVLRPM